MWFQSGKHRVVEWKPPPGVSAVSFYPSTSLRVEDRVAMTDLRIFITASSTSLLGHRSRVGHI